jgi:hypothetical protein
MTSSPGQRGNIRFDGTSSQSAQLLSSPVLAPAVHTNTTSSSDGVVSGGIPAPRWYGRFLRGVPARRRWCAEPEIRCINSCQVDGSRPRRGHSSAAVTTRTQRNRLGAEISGEFVARNARTAGSSRTASGPAQRHHGDVTAGRAAGCLAMSTAARSISRREQPPNAFPRTALNASGHQDRAVELGEVVVHGGDRRERRRRSQARLLVLGGASVRMAVPTGGHRFGRVGRCPLGFDVYADEDAPAWYSRVADGRSDSKPR